MAGLPPIRTPWAQHWRRVRYQLAPVVVFVGALLLVGWLWGRQVGLPNAVGEVNAVRVDVLSPVDGEIVALPGKPLGLFDEVKQGQMIARLDDRAAFSLLTQLQTALARLRIDLQNTILASSDRQISLKATGLGDARALALDIERQRLVIIERQGAIETDKVELTRLTERCDTVRPLVEKGIESRLSLMALEAQRDVVKQRIESTRKTVAEAEAQKAACEQRLKEFPTIQAAEVEKLMAPIREAISTEEARLQEVRRLMASREVRAPISGIVAAIRAWPGQNIAAGGVLLTIAGTEGQYILSYVREGQRIAPAVGMPVNVQARRIPRDAAWAFIEQIGPQVESVPAHQLRDPKTQEWGLPVRIAMPPGMKLKPGELVDVAFNRAPVEPVR